MPTNYGSGATSINVVDVTATWWFRHCYRPRVTGITEYLLAPTSRLPVPAPSRAHSTASRALNYGSGATSINAVDVTATGANRTAILARNGRYGAPAGTDLSITSTGTVSGAYGIRVLQFRLWRHQYRCKVDVAATGAFGTAIFAL